MDDSGEAFFGQIRQARDNLRLMAEASQRLRGGDAVFPPAPESIAMSDLAAEQALACEEHTDPVGMLFVIATYGLVSAEDHAFAMCDLLAERERVPIYSHVVLARALLESAGRAAWLVDGQGGVRGRIARSINDQLYSLHYFARMPSDVHRNDPRTRQAELRRAAVKLGLDLTPNGYAVEDRPSSGRIVKNLLGDGTVAGVLYNYQSAVAHGTLYALFASVEPNSVTESPLEVAPRATVGTSSVGVLGAFAAAQLGLLNAVEAVRSYFGWPEEGWSGSGWKSLAESAAQASLDQRAILGQT